MSCIRSVSMMFLVGLSLGGFSACGSVLLNTPVTKSADGWKVTLSQVKEGPDEYIGEEVTLTPAKGEKYIWAVLTVRNEGAEEQTFTYDECMLGEKGQGTAPLVVDRHLDRPATGDRAEAFPPGQERTRDLIYRYPKEQRPTRMKCGNIVLPIPGSR